MGLSQNAVETEAMKRSKFQVRKNQNGSAFVFMSPWLLGMLLLTAGSMLFTLYLSFTHYDLLSPPKFAGTANFHRLLTDSDFWVAIRVTFIYVIASVPVRLITALLVAQLVSKPIRGMGIYRALIYLPSMIAGSVGASIGWRKLFGQNGPINSFLHLFGIHGPIWLGSPATAMIVLVLLNVWQFGSEMVIFLAGIKQIPGFLYEAATIDGANAVQRFFRVTLPMLSPITFFNLLMGTISSFMVFTQVYVITDGGPLNSTLFYVLYLYQQGFQFFHMGYAATLSVILLLIIVLCAGVLFWSAKLWVNYDV